jgi:hypothetical protein
MKKVPTWIYLIRMFSIQLIVSNTIILWLLTIYCWTKNVPMMRNWPVFMMFAFTALVAWVISNAAIVETELENRSASSPS